MALASRSLGQAEGSKHKPTRPTTLVLHPRWHVVAKHGVESVLGSGHYVFIGGDAGSGALIDEETGKRLTLVPPTGCYFDNANSAALGGSWIVATCNPPPPGPRYLYELYSIPNATWTPFTPDVHQMFASNADCKTGDPQCSASYFAVGNNWIEFQITCGYHCGPTTFAFQNIQSGQVVGQPPGWQPGGTEIPDLNSPILTRTLCAPLTVPSGSTDTNQTLPGTILLSGRFAVAQQWSPYNLNLYTYLERCGSTLHELLTPELSSRAGQFAINQHALIWVGGGGSVHGLFLPSLRRFRFRIPQQAALYCFDMTPVCIGTLTLTSRTLYLLTNVGQLWTTNIPLHPAPANERMRR